MAYQDRIGIYERVEAIRSRPLICYVTSIRPKASGQIAPDVIPELIKQISCIPPEQKNVDFMVVSNGGDAIAAARIISLLRERFEKVAVLVPYVAYSAATLIALGADEIIMHPFSNLGPVDPQMTVTRKSQDGSLEQINYGTEDLRNYFGFVRTDVGISDQEHMAKAFELLGKEIGAVPIGIARRSAQLSLALGEKLLSLHMKDASQAKVITETLSKSYHHHGYPVGRSDAEEIGLPVVRESTDLEQCIWDAWENIETEMECHRIFEPLEVILNSPEGQPLVAPVPQVQLPANLPPQILQQAYNQILQQIQILNVTPVDYELFLTTIESPRCRSDFKATGKISAARLPDMKIVVNIVGVSARWTFSQTGINEQREAQHGLDSVQL